MSNHFRFKKTLAAAALAAAVVSTSGVVVADEVKPGTVPAAKPATPAPAGPPASLPPKPDFVTASADKGFSIQSGDGAFQLKLRAYLQADGRFFLEDPPSGDGTEFLMRRVRPVIEATVYKYYKFRVMPDFAGSNTSLQDAYAETAFNFPINGRIGKFKAPVGLERLQSATALLFPERGLPTNLVPNRDLGVQLQGVLGEGLFEYQAGVFDGTPDGGSVNNDVDDSKEFAGRVWFRPLKSLGATFAELGVGFAGTYGKKSGETTAGNSQVASYRTSGQQNFFSYGATVVADGTQFRLAPQAYWYVGPFGLLTEYVRSSQDVAVPGDDATIDNDAWQVAGSWVVTGEANSYKGITPANNLSFDSGGLGALEVVARVGGLEVDGVAFPVFANPDTSAKEALNFGAGLNWHWNKSVKVSAAYEHTSFDGGATNGDRDDEDIVFTRVQLAF